MNVDNLSRRLRGAVGNALVWGAGWAACAVVVFAGLKVTGILPASVIWPDAILIAARLGFAGGVTGAAFSLIIGMLYRGRRLSQINALRFGAGGAIVAGLFVPTFLQTMNLLSGGGMVAMKYVMDDMLLAAAFGGVAAGLSLKLAQRAELLLPGGSQDRPGLSAGGEFSPPVGAWDGRRKAPIQR